MNTGRILALAEHLKKLPRAAFDMNAWAYCNRDSTPSMEAVNECQMTACLGGHAALLFPDDLKLVEEGPFFDIVTRGLRGEMDGEFDGADAVARALDICATCADELTDPDAPHQHPNQAAGVLIAIAQGRAWETATNPSRTCGPLCQFGVWDCNKTSPAERALLTPR